MSFQAKIAYVGWMVVAGGALLSGCGQQAAAPPAAPGLTPAANRQAMIEWHRQHDQPGVGAPTGR